MQAKASVTGFIAPSALNGAPRCGRRQAAPGRLPLSGSSLAREIPSGAQPPGLTSPRGPRPAPSRKDTRRTAHWAAAQFVHISAHVEDYQVILLASDHALRLVVSHGMLALPRLSALVDETS
jgi:hypothetical protein